LKNRIKKNFLNNNVFVKITIILILFVFNLYLYKIIKIEYVWVQLSVIPIGLSAYYWRKKIAIPLALFFSVFPLIVNLFVDKPYVPEELFGRVIVYLFIAVFASYFFEKMDQYNNDKIEYLYKSKRIGLYNSNKLLPDIRKLLNDNKEFCVFVITIDNYIDLNKYLKYDIATEFIMTFIKKIKSSFKDQIIYSINNDEYIILKEISTKNELYNKIPNIYKFFDDPLSINGYLLKLELKVGVYDYCGEKINEIEVLNRARIASDKCNKYEHVINIYDKSYDLERSLYYEISSGLKKALDNDEFYLVYQPVIDLVKREIASVEVLIRWNRNDKKAIGPAEFIKVAEDTGMIGYITKWVLQNAALQYKESLDAGYNIKCSINFSANDLLDENLVNWAIEYLNDLNIKKKDFGIEITERQLSTDSKKLNKILSLMKKNGFIIEIDDFGTGYNSLINIVEIPFDIIKIDKYFIDNIHFKNVEILVKHIIEAVHETGGIIIAEGVETKEQASILNKIKCDRIQGYYFGKPLKLLKLQEYYRTFDMNDYDIS
jgi:EAL domain-containing protein (putative c-di-GMP-specific phosphodiesterase class I)/GGDEF domain-containing protein